MPNDSAGILQCLREAFDPYRGSYTPDAFADTILTPEMLDRRAATMTLFVAVSDGAVVGTIGGHAVDSHRGHIRGMAVLPDWKGSGVAAKLLNAVEAELQARGCSRITLNTTQPLQSAMRFYEKHGYRSTGNTKDFFGMPLIEYAKTIGN